jgi:adenine-specific DNA-methyltransferase
MDSSYLTKQIITYMGNKRKMLPMIQHIIETIELREDGKKLTMADGFSGSGIVSRLMKTRASKLYTNDISDYSLSLNKCYLSNITDTDEAEIKRYMDIANEHAKQKLSFTDPFISGNWSPLGDVILPTERAYFTKENGHRIDIYRNYIETLPDKYKPFLLGPLLVEASIHNNTSGQFSAFYKNGNTGKYGGKNEIDLQRIEKPIELTMPLSWNNDCEVHISQGDTNEWIQKIPPVDLVYYDPPYNKHPYSIYYFMLNVIQQWDKKQVVPKTTRGQALDWHRSAYNSFKHAEKEFKELIRLTKAKYILISYNNGGIIPLDILEDILKEHGTVEKFPIEHSTYNRLKGISEYKRTTEKVKIKEFMWLLKKKTIG